MNRYDLSRRHPTHRSGLAGLLRASFFPVPALVLALAAALTSGCVAAPAVMLTSATVTAAAVVNEGERLVQEPAPVRSAEDRDLRNDEAEPRKACGETVDMPEGNQGKPETPARARRHCAAHLQPSGGIQPGTASRAAM